MASHGESYEGDKFVALEEKRANLHLSPSLIPWSQTAPGTSFVRCKMQRDGSNIQNRKAQ